MSKKKRKGKGKKRKGPNISPLVSLRPNLDQLLSDESLAKDKSVLEKLHALFSKVKESDALPIFVQTYLAVPTSIQQHLDDILPEWILEHHYQNTLQQLYNNNKFDPPSEKVVVAWLEKCGITSLQKVEKKIEFYGCYKFENPSQAMILVAWYTNSNRSKVQAMSFLLDFHPPWEGAIKDAMVLPQRPPEKVTADYVDSWTAQGMPVVPTSETDAKEKIIEALKINRKQQLRLPVDLTLNKDIFCEFVLALPDTEETSSFTSTEFEALTKEGKSTKEILDLEEQMREELPLGMGKWKGEPIVIAPFDYSSLTIKDDVIPATSKDKALIKKLKEIDKKIDNDEDYEDLFYSMSDKCTDLFIKWLIDKGVEEKLAGDFCGCSEVYLNFLYNYCCVGLKSVDDDDLFEFFDDFLLRKVIVEYDEYTLWPPALKLFYRFLEEKGYFQKSASVTKKIDELEPYFIDLLKKQFS